MIWNTKNNNLFSTSVELESDNVCLLCFLTLGQAVDFKNYRNLLKFGTDVLFFQNFHFWALSGA